MSDPRQRGPEVPTPRGFVADDADGETSSDYPADVPRPAYSPAPEEPEIPVPRSRTPPPEDDSYVRSRGQDVGDHGSRPEYARRSRSRDHDRGRSRSPRAGERAYTAPMRPFSPGGRPLKCFVGNLNPDCRLFNLREKFAPFGPITNVEIKTNLGCGFVEYETADACVAACEQLDGITLMGQRIRVEAQRQSSSTGERGGRRGQFDGHRGGGGGGGAQQGCFNCGAPDHWSKHCPHPPSSHYGPPGFDRDRGRGRGRGGARGFGRGRGYYRGGPPHGGYPGRAAGYDQGYDEPYGYPPQSYGYPPYPEPYGRPPYHEPYSGPGYGPPPHHGGMGGEEYGWGGRSRGRGGYAPRGRGRGGYGAEYGSSSRGAADDTSSGGGGDGHYGHRTRDAPYPEDPRAASARARSSRDFYGSASSPPRSNSNSHARTRSRSPRKPSRDGAYDMYDGQSGGAREPYA